MKRKMHFYISCLVSVLSVLSLIVSVRSCQISDKALALAGADYTQARMLILKADFSKNDGILLKPINPDISLLKATVYFPSDIYMGPVSVGSGGELLGMKSLIGNIQDIVLKKVPRESGFVKMKFSRIPVIVESYYAAKGDTYNDKSLYFLEYRALVDSDVYKDPSIYFDNLVFVFRVVSEINNVDVGVIDKIFNNELHVLMPYGLPSIHPKK